MKITIIIPVYNEAERILPTLKSVDKFFSQHEYKSELIIVDDGSSDNTAELVAHFRKQSRDLKLIRLKSNQGKGEAVRRGVLKATGDWILFMDADSSTNITEISKLLKYTKNSEVIIGSRYLKADSIKRRQPWYRHAVGRIGNRLVQLILLPNIKDTQCGFKLFSQNAAHDLFSRMRIKSWSFDLEILALAKILKYQITEVSIVWRDSPYGRINIVRDSIMALLDLFRIRWWIFVSQLRKQTYTKPQNS